MKIKTKVLHLLSSNQYSGAENVVCTIIKLMRGKYDMVYCSPMGSIEKHLNEKDIVYYPVKNMSIIELKKVLDMFKPDIIHAHDNRASVLASFFGKKYKVISHIHGNNKIMNSLNFKTILFNYCSKNLKHIIWVSKSSLNDYYFKSNVINKSTVLRNVIDAGLIKEKSKEYRSNRFDIIFLGRLGYPKNPTRLIKIIRDVINKIPNLKIAIVGDGPDYDSVKQLIKEYSIEKNIILFGFQSNPYPILSNSKILIMTSIYEGTPMCALEAQALGKPVVATPVDGLKEIIKNGYNGYLSNDDNEIVESLYNMLTSDRKYNELSNNSLNEFKMFNDLNNYIDTITRIYKGE